MSAACRLGSCLAGLLLLAACQRDAPRPPPATATTAPAPAPIASPVAPPIAAEQWELPGALGPLTTRQELDARFGKANVREETFDGAEGIGTYPALVVFPDDPSRRLELVLDAEDKDAPIQELRVRAPVPIRMRSRSATRCSAATIRVSPASAHRWRSWNSGSAGRAKAKTEPRYSSKR
jgi:hypothetical protein